MAIPRPFAPASVDAGSLAAVEPLYRSLLDRSIASADDLEQLVLDRSDLDALVAERAANLYIATTRNTKDKAAEGAFLAFVRDVEPHLKPLASALDKKIALSPHAARLPKARYEVLLRGLMVDIELFREANIPLETELAELDQKYNQTIGAMSVEFEGRTRTMPQMARFLEETDRALRERAWRAIAARRLEARDAIEDVYDRMLALRQQIAANAGFPNFRDFQHRRLKRFDYTPDDCLRMHAAIEEHLVPIQRRLDRERAREIGASPLRPWDLAVDVKGRGPLRPFEKAQELVDGCSRMFHAMGGGLGEMFDELRKGDCLDLESRDGKAPGGYQYQRQHSRQPFIFMNAAGMHRDLVTMVHEAGHAFHSLLSKDDPLVEYRSAPTEFAEAWRALVGRFGNDVSWEGCEEARDHAWHRQLHLFGMPFYYIEYGIAETGAIQMWLASRRDQAQALANYRKGLALGGSRPLPELFAAAGLRFDLSSALMKELASEVDRELVRA